MNDEAARQGRLIQTISCSDRNGQVGGITCPTCGQTIGIKLEAELERLAREVAAVDRAVRVRKLAAVRDESPFKLPASVQAELGRAA